MTTLLNIDSFNSQQREFIFESDFIRTEFFDKGLEILSVFTKKQYAFFNEETLNYSFQKTPIENQLTFSFSPIIQTKIFESKLAISKDANSFSNIDFSISVILCFLFLKPSLHL